MLDYEWTDTVRANIETFARAVMGQADYPFSDAEKVGNIAALEAICAGPRRAGVLSP